MKRYDIMLNWTLPATIEEKERFNGEWVKAEDAEKLEQENTRLKELNREMVEAMVFVCLNVCPEAEREECRPGGYNRNCPALKVLTKVEGEGE